jgi:peroxiredoxin Q/BCP
MHADLVKKGYKVYGMSADAPKSQAIWKAKHTLPYHLLSDTSADRQVLRALGVSKGKSIARSHIVIGKGGVVEKLAYGVSPTESIEQSKALLLAS